VAGVLLLLLTAAPFAAAIASPAADTCAMCAARCCCRPAVERGGGCRLTAPCGAREPGVATASPVTRVIVPPPFRLSRPEVQFSELTQAAAARALRMAAVPPDPPPRLPAA
jgi:hypothetical protein